MAESKNNVNTPSRAYNDMQARFALCEALMGGTLVMRAHGETYLPQFSKELDERYTTRVDNSVLFEAFKNAVDSLSQRPFGESVTLSETAPQFYKDIALDVDLSGTSLTTFARDCLRDVLVYGKCHILVDFPNTRELEERLQRTLRLSDEKAFKVRPYFVRISPADVIGWKGSRFAGVEELERVRFREFTVEQDPSNEWSEVETNRVVVWDKSTIVTYVQRLDSNKNEIEWVPESSAENSLGAVPIVTIYANRESLLKSYPPMRGLADLNQKHWRNSSDQDTIETVNRVPLLALIGFSESDVGSVAIGPYKVISAKSANAEVKIVETTGKAVEVGRKSLDKLEMQMQALTMMPLIQRPGNPTATGLAIDAAREVSDLEAYVMLLEKGLGEALDIARQWAKQAGAAPDVSVSQDFGPLPTADDLKSLQWDLEHNLITAQTYLEERKRLGGYTDEFVVGDELEALELAEGDTGDVDDMQRIEDEETDELEEEESATA